MNAPGPTPLVSRKKHVLYWKGRTRLVLLFFSIIKHVIYFFEVHRMGKRESVFQRELVKQLKQMFPGSYVMKTDPRYRQGFPDLIILYKDHWAALECKRSEHEFLYGQRPNQAEYIRTMNEMSYASFIYPENKERVLHDLQVSFGHCGTACISGGQQVPLARVRRRKAQSVVPKVQGCSERDRAS